MPARRRREVACLISILIYAGIFLMSSMPASALPARIPDFIPHCAEYALLAFFFIQVFRDPAGPRTTAIAFALLLLLGFLDELHQRFVPGRFFRLSDLLFDALGSAGGLLAYRWLRRWSDKKRRGR